MFRKLLLFTACLLLLVFTLTSLAELRSTNWDWDIDHRMYFGSRLLHGELIWTHEYDDKLPLMQFLFAIPALARSVRVWQLMSIGMILSAACGLYLWMSRVLQREWQLPASQSKTIGLLSACLYPYLIAVLPGSISHHNAAAASIFTLGLIAALPIEESSPDKAKSRTAHSTRFWLAALLMATAISLRPYYLFAALMAAPWQTVRERLGLHPRLRSRALSTSMLLRCALWTGAIALCGLALNATPYVLSGNLNAFQNGLILLSQDTVPFQLWEMLKIQFNTIITSRFVAFFAFSLPPLLSIGILTQIADRRLAQKLPMHWRGAEFTDILFACLLLPASLEGIILNKHYFPHYQQLFAPFACLGFAFFLASLTHGLSPRELRLTPQQHGALAAFCIVFLLAAFRIGLTAPLPALFHPSLESRLASYAVLNPQGKGGALGESFLAPSSMFLHWKLDQSRHGFPHAALTGFIHSGFWESASIPTSLGFPFPTTATEYCEQLINRGPQQVIDTAESPSIRCLRRDPKARYVKSHEFTLPTGDPDLHLYVRRSRSLP